MALFKDGELVHMLERHHIEGRPAEMIAENLKDAYNDHCYRPKMKKRAIRLFFWINLTDIIYLYLIL